MDFILLVLFSVAVITVSLQLKEARLKKAAQDGERYKSDSDNLVNKQFDFHTRRPQILALIRSKLAAKQFRPAMLLALEYVESGIVDEELIILYEKSVAEMNTIGLATSHRSMGFQYH